MNLNFWILHVYTLNDEFFSEVYRSKKWKDYRRCDHDPSPSVWLHPTDLTLLPKTQCLSNPFCTGLWRCISYICGLTSSTIGPGCWITSMDPFGSEKTIHEAQQEYVEYAYIPFTRSSRGKYASYASSDPSTSDSSDPASQDSNARRTLAWRSETSFGRSCEGAERAVEAWKIGAFVEPIGWGTARQEIKGKGRGRCLWHRSVDLHHRQDHLLGAMKLFMIFSEIKVAECVRLPEEQLHREEMQRWML